MAEFCKACSIELFGRDTGGLAGITTKKNEQQGRAVIVICEGCGVIQVDNEGNCISPDCQKAGHPGHGVRGGDSRQHDRGKGFLNINKLFKKGETKC